MTTRLLERVIAPDSRARHLATVEQLSLLPAKNLRLHLSKKSLVTVESSPLKHSNFMIVSITQLLKL